MKTLSKTATKEAFDLFRAEADGLAKGFRCDCDSKLFGHAIKTHLTSQHLDIVHTAAGCQLSNGLVESHRKTMVHISCTYLTEKQTPRNF